ncbi:hypothetical protein ACFQY0_01220 [Haloferula chungangensis]|uniref:Discoidin domain-containing protein n=1 Tax=Haloferula chungangensis TaxID=1048331 RepID=A0ABW2L2H5_9BACT
MVRDYGSSDLVPVAAEMDFRHCRSWVISRDSLRTSSQFSASLEIGLFAESPWNSRRAGPEGGRKGLGRHRPMSGGRSAILCDLSGEGLRVGWLSMFPALMMIGFAITIRESIRDQFRGAGGIMKAAYLFFVCFALCFIGCTKTDDSSISAKESRLKAIECELKELADLSLRSGVGSIGCRSPWYKVVDHSSWMEIDLGKTQKIDQVVLVPVLRRDIDGSFQADAFPLVFQVLAGTADDPHGTVLAEYTESDALLPRIAPLVVPCGGVMASWVRVEVSRLTPRGFDGRYVFQLSELLVFSGPDNVALHQPVTTSFEMPADVSGAWGRRFLVDGAMPYVMNSPQGGQSLAYVSDSGLLPDMTLDLGSEYPLSEIHLHAVEQDDTVPQAFAGDMGIPRHFRIAGAKLPDFRMRPC